VALYILVGVSAGYGAAVLLLKVIIPRLIEPLKESGTDAFWLGLVPLALCLLLALMLVPRTVRAGTLPLSFLVGAARGGGHRRDFPRDARAPASGCCEPLQP
jgi:hypothetical protein